MLFGFGFGFGFGLLLSFYRRMGDDLSKVKRNGVGDTL
jgi:hypothetical protein